MKVDWLNMGLYRYEQSKAKQSKAKQSKANGAKYGPLEAGFRATADWLNMGLYEHFELRKCGDGYNILVLSGDDPSNTYNQNGWMFSSQWFANADVRIDSSYVVLSEVTGGQGDCFRFKKFESYYKISLIAHGDDRDGWELAADRICARDKRNSVSTYTTLHHPSTSGRPSCHFE